MTIEEKARAYDEALKRAKDYSEGHTLDVNPQAAMEYVFPELAQSKDERIRKGLIQHLEILRGWTPGDPSPIKVKEHYDAWLAWLEKLGDIDKASYDIAEKEKREFVGDGFIKCYADFQDFKEGETYWLEYLGNDNYNIRSDNLLGKTYHITPCQLYTIFKKQTWLEKQGQEKHLSEPIDEQSDNCYTCTNDKGCVTCENGELYKEKSTDYTKSNREKAQEIVNINTERLLRGIRQNHDISKDERDQVRFDAYNLLLDMAEWKDKQVQVEKQALIDKACEWLKDNARNYYSAYATEDRLIEDFKKAMKGGEE